MLYECWRKIAKARKNEMCVLELSSGRRWSFGQLAAEAEKTAGERSSVVFPRGTSTEFVLAVLHGWKTRSVVCPLEPGQVAPKLVEELPARFVHLKTTSATTGTPRLVAFTAGQLAADATNIVETMGLRPEWANLGLISLAHSYGFSNLVLPLLLHGIPLVLAGSALPEALRRAVATVHPVTVAAVPALWQTWHDAGVITDNIRLAISAGAPLPLTLEKAVFERCGLKVHNFYGSSECGGIAYDGTVLPRADASCAGAPMRHVDVSLAEDGCIQVTSKAVGEAYWPHASAGLRHGVFRTSDLGMLKDGLVYLRGRAGDQINVAGRKVLPETVESVLAGHPQVRACLAFGVPSDDPQRGETIVACIAASGDVTAENVRQYALSKLPAWQVPRQWWFVEGLEPNGRGKLSRAQWRERYLEQAVAEHARARRHGGKGQTSKINLR